VTPRFDVVSRAAGDTVLVRAAGEVDYTSIALLADALADSQAVAAVVVLDLRGVEFIDSMGIGVMLEAHGRAQAHGTEFRVVPGPAALRLINAAGLEGRLAVEHPLTVLDVQYPAEPSTVPTARKAFAEAFADLPDDLLENGKIVLSELVTNAVRHGADPDDGWVHLVVHHVPMGMRIEVTDSGESTSEPVLRSGTEARTSGWGLFLVARLAERWGVERDQTTTVWCELDLSAAASSQV
jgi:anti-anti-sigma factor